MTSEATAPAPVRTPSEHARLPIRLLVFVHVLILIYGGCYTYALTPLGNLQ